MLILIQQLLLTLIIIKHFILLIDNIKFDPKDRSQVSEVPAIFLTKSGKNTLLSDDASDYKIDVQISVSPSYRKARNVIG